MALVPLLFIPHVAAHVSGRGLILLLPTQLFVAGGAAVVLVSFVLLALIPMKKHSSSSGRRVKIFSIDGLSWLPWLSIASLSFTLFLVFAGWYGSRDPLRNPMPLFIWSLWWPGMTIITLLLGNIWSAVNPWTGLYQLIVKRTKVFPVISYPRRLAYMPAVFFFAAFAWLELIHPSPTDPAFLSNVVLSYLILQFIGLFLFGEAWMKHCEAFSVFFTMVSWNSPVSAEKVSNVLKTGRGDETSAAEKLEVYVGYPTRKLMGTNISDFSHILFIILSLSTVSFDGFSRTFTWLAMIGVNPLDYPGRTALLIPNTFGMLVMFAAIFTIFAVATFLAKAVVFRSIGLQKIMALFIPSIVPIAMGYHVAHYFPYILADFQTVYHAFSDPFGLKWNLFGVSGPPAIPSFLKDPIRLYYVYYVQVALIVLVHVIAVYVGHRIAIELSNKVEQAMVSQLPMTLLMVAYTMFGLSLLSMPTAD